MKMVGSREVAGENLKKSCRKALVFHVWQSVCSCLKQLPLLQTRANAPRFHPVLQLGSTLTWQDLYRRSLGLAWMCRVGGGEWTTALALCPTPSQVTTRSGWSLW